MENSKFKKGDLVKVVKYVHIPDTERYNLLPIGRLVHVDMVEKLNINGKAIYVYTLNLDYTLGWLEEELELQESGLTI